MKKILLSLTVLILCCAYSVAETRQVILLLHNGSGRAFALDQLQQAVDAAEAGDTLYLNEGNYPLVDTLDITKGVSIIGAGTSTVLTGVINISIPDSVTLKAHILDALRVTGNIRVQKPVNGLKFRKVTLDTGIIWDAITRDVEIDRCYVTTFNSTSNLKSATVVNSRINQEYVPYRSEGDNFGNSTTFFNCAIREVVFNSWSYMSGKDYNNNYSTYINSIIIKSNLYWFANSTFFNCLMNGPAGDTGLTHENCYVVSGTFEDWSKTNGTTWSQDELIANGWLGNDGTVVGPEGGSAPYTLIPTGISVRNSKLTIDGENRTLNVRLKLTAN